MIWFLATPPPPLFHQYALTPTHRKTEDERQLAERMGMARRRIKKAWSSINYSILSRRKEKDRD
jgi:hypothetical protein